jgi:hypothetical protein
MIYRMAWWTGIGAGLAGTLAAYRAQWPEATAFGLLAVVCAVIVAVMRPPE